MSQISNQELRHRINEAQGQSNRYKGLYEKQKQKYEAERITLQAVRSSFKSMTNDLDSARNEIDLLLLELKEKPKYSNWKKLFVYLLGVITGISCLFLIAEFYF